MFNGCFCFQNPVDDMFAKMWVLCEPLMFGLIGAEVDISKIQPSTIGEYIHDKLKEGYWKVYLCSDDIFRNIFPKDACTEV